MTSSRATDREEANAFGHMFSEMLLPAAEPDSMLDKPAVAIATIHVQPAKAVWASSGDWCEVPVQVAR